jgi:hypothetical protein
MDQIAEIFISISKYLDLSTTGTSVLPLVESCIFPVVTEKSHSDFDSLCTATEADMWFIADLKHLRESFEGLVPLLAFDSVIIE